MIARPTNFIQRLAEWEAGLGLIGDFFRGAEITLLELEIYAYAHEAMLFPAADSYQEIRTWGPGGYRPPADAIFAPHGPRAALSMSLPSSYLTHGSSKT
jgi:hypothetical protein